MYKIKMDKAQPVMEKVDKKKLDSNSSTCYVKLSKNVIKAMRKKAGIVNSISDNAILYAYITKTLSE